MNWRPSLADRAKRALVGTRFGAFAERLRSAYDVYSASLSDAGCVASDLLATELIVKLGARGFVFVDVGAHIGSVCAGVLAVSSTTKVVAVEAIPQKADHLRTKFQRVVVHQCAVGEGTGEVSFFVDRKLSGCSSLAEAPGALRIDVPLRRLDDLVQHADCIKMDIEGAELGALRGAAGLVDRSRPLVMFESAPGAGERLGYPLGAMFDWWAQADYQLFVPNRVAHDGPALSRDSFIESHAYPRRCTNYFGIPREKRIDVRDAARIVLA